MANKAAERVMQRYHYSRLVQDMTNLYDRLFPENEEK